MNILSPYRKHLLGAALLFSAVLAGRWGFQDYLPRARALAVKAGEVETLREDIRTTRLQMVAMGPAERDLAIENYRRRNDELSRVVPGADATGVTGRQMTRAMSATANRFNVRLHSVEPLEASTTGEFEVGGFSAQVVGKYHDVGSFLTEMLSVERVTELGAVRIDAIPDTVMLEASGRERDDEIGAIQIGDGNERQVRIPPGEEPFDVSATFTLRWFSTRGASERAGDNEHDPNPSTTNAF